MSKEALLERFRAGQQLARARRFAEAEAAFRDCLAMREGDIPARNQLAMTLARMGRAAEAEREFLETLRRDPENVPALSQLGGLYERAGKVKEAEALYRKCLAIRPGDAPATLQLTRLCMARGEWEEAEAFLRAAIPQSPARGDAPAICQLGMVYAKMGREDEATALWQQCLALDPSSIQARHQLGMQCARQGKNRKAELLFRECLKLDPRQYQARHQLGMLYTKQDRYVEAEAEFLECIRLDARQTAAYQHLGVLYDKQGRYAEAEEMYRACLSRKPSPEMAAQLAIFRAERGDGAEALSLLGRIPKGKAKSRARLMCAAALGKAGRTGTAGDLLAAILHDEPDNIKALHQYGCLYLKNRAYGEARRYFDRVLALEPENPLALHSLAELFMEEGEAAKAIALLERIAAENADHFIAQSLGRITGEEYDPQLVWQELARHLQDDKTKPRHGVFRLNTLELNQAVAQCLAAARYECRGMTRRYTLNWPGAGYAGGRDGDGRVYNAITVVTYWDGARIITAYPSDPVTAEEALAI